MAQHKSLQEDARFEPDDDESMEADSSPKTQLDIEWQNRRLCKDENCIGVIGPDGLCKECGRPYTDDTPSPEAGFIDEQEMEPESDDAGAMKLAPLDNEWENRKLCSDESCIGVIGPDGCCKVCGKSYLH